MCLNPAASQGASLTPALYGRGTRVVPFCLPLVWSPPRLLSRCLPPAPSALPGSLTSFDVLHFTAAGNGEPTGDKRGDGVTGSRCAGESQRADALPQPSRRKRVDFRKRPGSLPGSGGAHRREKVGDEGGRLRGAAGRQLYFPQQQEGSEPSSPLLMCQQEGEGAEGPRTCLAERLAGSLTAAGSPAAHRQPPALCAALCRFAGMNVSAGRQGAETVQTD